MGVLALRLYKQETYCNESFLFRPVESLRRKYIYKTSGAIIITISFM